MLMILAGTANVGLANDVARQLGVAPCRRTATRFADSELHVELEQSVRGHDVYLIQPTSRPVDEHLMELLFLGDACQRAGAARVTAVVPYFGYARQDRRASGREPVGAALAARVIEAAGFARIVAVDLHAPEIEGFFRVPFEHLSATALLASTLSVPADSVIVAPDLGAVKLAERYRARLDLPVAVLHKMRVTGSDVVVRGVIGDVRDRAPLVVDDMITTGSTIDAAVRAVLDAGARAEVSVAAAHAVFAGSAVARLRALPIRQLVTTDSVEIDGEWPPHFQRVSLAPLLADTIRRLHQQQSLEPLLAHA